MEEKPKVITNEYNSIVFGSSIVKDSRELMYREETDSQNTSKKVTKNSLSFFKIKWIKIYSFQRINWYLAFCLLIAVFGSSFQYGYNIGLYNTPYAV